jgi:hypothetical protein
MFFYALFLAFLFYFLNQKTISLFFLFFIIGEGFQVIPPILLDFGLHSVHPYDFVLIYVLVVFFFEILSGRIQFNHNDKVARAIFLFYLFLLVAAGYDFFVVQDSFDNIFRTSRHFLLLLAYFVFKCYTREEIEKIVKLLFIITLLQSIIFLFQVITKESLLFGGTVGETTIGKYNVKRFNATPFFIVFYIFYALFKDNLRRSVRSFFMFISFAVIILSYTRSALMSIISTLILAFFLWQNRNRTWIFQVVLVASIIIIPIYPIFTARIEQATASFDYLFSGKYSKFGWDKQDTFIFRIAHAQERLNFTVSTPESTFFGIGFVPEDKYRKNTFKINSFDESTGQTSQLNIGDIAWSYFFLRLGIVGTLFYVYVYITTIGFFFRNLKNNIAFITFLFMFLNIIASFSTTAVCQGQFWLLPFMMIALVEKQNSQIPVITNAPQSG